MSRGGGTLAARIETVGDRIRRLREELGLSQEELGELTQLGERIIARIESGAPSNAFLALIAGALKVSEEYLKTGEGANGRPSEGDLVRYAERRFQHPSVRQAFVEYATLSASYRDGKRSERDLAAVEKSFLESDSYSVELECFYLPGDEND